MKKWQKVKKYIANWKDVKKNMPNQKNVSSLKIH